MHIILVVARISIVHRLLLLIHPCVTGTSVEKIKKKWRLAGFYDHYDDMMQQVVGKRCSNQWVLCCECGDNLLCDKCCMLQLTTEPSVLSSPENGKKKICI